MPHPLRPIIEPADCARFCTCGRPHPSLDVLSYPGEDAFDHLASHVREENLSGEVVLLEDENTRKAAGDSVADAFVRNQAAYRRITLRGDAALSDTLAEKLAKDCEQAALIIAVGAGTVNDFGKYVSTGLNIPYWTVPAAPSMNGYTSSIAAIKVRGVKRTLPAVPPKRIYARPDVIQNSPLILRQSGFCDLLAKSVSDTDWLTESLLFSGSYCALPSSIVAESESVYLQHPEGIRNGEADAVLGLYSGLIISGIAMTLAGSSAPASGGEHLISHFLDMRESITERVPELHGLQVGAGVILSAVCYDLLADLSREDLKPSARNAFDTGLETIPDIWGPYADEVRTQFQKKEKQLLSFDTRLPEKWELLKALFANVRKPEFLLDLIHKTGYEMTLSALRLSEEEFRNAALAGRTIRDRITVLDVAAHAGVLEEAVRKTIFLMSV